MLSEPERRENPNSPYSNKRQADQTFIRPDLSSTMMA